MMFFNISKRQFQAIVAIISRNAFLLINAIVTAVVILLTFFGDTQEGVFLGFITILNIGIGCFQEINSWVALERLQLLAAPRVVRIKRAGDKETAGGEMTTGGEEIILVEAVTVGDIIKLAIGDQIPCDGTLLSSHGFEINEALITGESTVFLRKPGDEVFAGGIVTSGAGTLEVKKVFAESRIALMTKSVKKYALILSPIQYSINTIIRYISYILIIIIIFVIARGYLINEATIDIVRNVGALTSMLLPQGMVVIVTLLFSYGAAHLYRKNVLLQEINATEKMGRIKNLCMDKTGTLTDNNLVLEHQYVAPGVKDAYCQESILAYVTSTQDSSQTIETIKKTFAHKTYSGSIIKDVSFSSTRQFGGVRVRDEFGERTILVGAPDIFLPYVESAKDRQWISSYINTEAAVGKRLLCFAVMEGSDIPSTLVGVKLSPVSIFVLHNDLREGVVEAVSFFQDRGVVIRIISGDNPRTVQSVAHNAGVHNTESVITGAELELWSADDFTKRAKDYRIFARIKPEQKERIIEALKLTGFTAMIGDGANDALAIKKSDLGIAMFDGAQATRQVASIVLVKNSFSDLPNGVKLADSVIQNIQICASIFFNQILLGFFFFVALTILGESFPFTPLNITFINYFTVGFPTAFIFYWIVKPVRPQLVAGSTSFMKQVIPFAFVSAIPQVFVAIAAFYESLEHVQPNAPTSLVAISFISLGVIFFMFAPEVYSCPITGPQKRQFLLLIVFEIIAISILVNISLAQSFYNIDAPSLQSVIEFVPLLAVYALIQAVVTTLFVKVHNTQNLRSGI